MNECDTCRNDEQAVSGAQPRLQGVAAAVTVTAVVITLIATLLG